jgi:hypothetical protein
MCTLGKRLNDHSRICTILSLFLRSSGPGNTIERDLYGKDWQVATVGRSYSRFQM